MSQLLSSQTEVDIYLNIQTEFEHDIETKPCEKANKLMKSF